MGTNGLLPLEPEAPALLGGYRLRGRLGEGGMGVVYLAGKPGSHVAIKTMRSADLGDPEARARFSAEAQCARYLDCDYTARVIRDGSDADLPYLVTEYIEGPSLSQAVRLNGPLAPMAVLAVAIGVADALAQIHEAGIVHRDIKPSNILLSETGPRIIDFGIAHMPDAPVAVTRTGMVMGSPGWVAPERLRGGRATPAADVFSWGLLVAFAATGRHPFGTDDGTRLAERILNLAPDLQGIDKSLRDLVAATLDKNPAARPTAAELRHDLVSHRHQNTAPLAIAELWTTTGPRPAPHRPEPFVRISLPAAATIAAALASALALGLLLNPDPGPSSKAQAPVVVSTPGPGVTVFPAPSELATDMARPPVSKKQQPPPPASRSRPDTSRAAAVPEPAPKAKGKDKAKNSGKKKGKE